MINIMCQGGQLFLWYGGAWMEAQEIKHNMRNVIWDDSPVDVTEEVNLIWSIANKLRGPNQSDKYKNVIIPMTIIRRFECALE